MPEKSSPLLAIYCWTGDIAGDYWFCKNKGKFSYEHPNSIGKNVHKVKEYYDKIASDYEAMVRSWGYHMPEIVINSLVRHGSLGTTDNASVLDLGCGDGLCGQILDVG